MIDIVKHINKHKESLQKGFSHLSIEQVTQLKLMALGFYFQLPRSKTIIERYINSPIDKEKLIEDIIKGSTSSYQEIMKKAPLQWTNMPMIMKSWNKYPFL